VGICLDVGHYIVGGGDPVRALADLGNRVTHVHLKDVDPAVLERLRAGALDGFGEAVRKRIFTELGAGALDLDAIIDLLVRRDYDGWLVIEQDSCWGPPSESAAIGRRVLAEALRRHGSGRSAEVRPR
jgi:inosose dehydratase